MTPYEILGVTETTSDADIKLAYKRAAMKYHPDRGGDLEEFDVIRKAYERIMKRPCQLCAGKGFVMTRDGAFKKREQCSVCWAR